MRLSRFNLGWAVALMEGEGTIGSYRGGSHKTIDLRLRVGMSDREPLERFAALFGGHVSGPYAAYSKSGVRHKSIYVVSFSGVVALAIFTLLRPHLSPRQRQGDRAVARWRAR